MTDEIIITNIDTSTCGYYRNGTCRAYMDNTGKNLLCINSPNCYYKQLKRKEKECEKLKEKAKELRQGWINCDKERNLQEANSEFRKRIIDRYKQAFDEIEDFLNETCNACKEFTPNRQSYIGCRYCQPTQILNIIKRAKEK